MDYKTKIIELVEKIESLAILKYIYIIVLDVAKEDVKIEIKSDGSEIR